MILSLDKDIFQGTAIVLTFNKLHIVSKYLQVRTFCVPPHWHPKVSTWMGQSLAIVFFTWKYFDNNIYLQMWNHPSALISCDKVPVVELIMNGFEYSLVSSVTSEGFPTSPFHLSLTHCLLNELSQLLHISYQACLAWIRIALHDWI